MAIGARTAQSNDWISLPVASLRGVGSRIAGRLAHLGVERVGDMLLHLPQRYEDRTRLAPIGSLRPGHKPLIQGKIELAEVAMRRRRSLLCRLTDETGALTLRFFHFSDAQRQQLQRGTWLRCYGEVRIGPTGLEMVHPEYTFVTAESKAVDASLTPVYPATEGLHQQKLRNLASQVLERLEDAPLEDYLAGLVPDSWPPLESAIRNLHRPPADCDTRSVLEGTSIWQRRVALEELVAHRLSLKMNAATETERSAIALDAPRDALDEFRRSLPFELTLAQTRVVEEIGADMSRPRPMHRLLQGDVGSGKTVVAAMACLIASRSGHQAAVMAPTELLAEQHYESLRHWLEPLNVSVGFISGAIKQRGRANLLTSMADGATSVVIGTHALIQKTVNFRSLALIVVDEQHRFGVEQRLTLKKKGEENGLSPHQLIMTATPIPRTLAMTAYADLDYSVIDELPPGRTPIKTVAVPERRRVELVRRIAEHCRSGQQAYWVCPLIDESETLDSSAATDLVRELSEALPGISVDLLHGRMKPAEKDDVMRRFKAAITQLLVATTVIEVGVDVPNATLMVVENSERMGLAQLHQLRGRVGRGCAASSCVLLYKPPLSEVARERLDVLRQTNDGFKIAESDLKLRGPGEVLGTRQTGMLRMRVADLSRDAGLLPMVIRISDELAASYPESVAPLVRRWVRGAEEYAKV